jgi:protein-L-isoaspartate(D-aspartate) O-methyltransferase
MVPPTALRTYYARLIAGKAGTNDPRLIEAFAAVEREQFVGSGPWKVNCHSAGYVETPSDDLAFLYQDIVVALVPERRLNNGEPHLHARCLAALKICGGETAVHVGSGTGYYTALLAHLVGPNGTVIAYEIDRSLARKAAENLAPWPQITVRDTSATDTELPKCDFIYVNAGATHPVEAWLEALRPGGRLLFPLTPNVGLGGMLLITRSAEPAFEASFVQPAMFIACEGARDHAEGEELGKAFARGDSHEVKSLRRGIPPDASSWCAGQGWWLSTRKAEVQ